MMFEKVDGMYFDPHSIAMMIDIVLILIYAMWSWLCCSKKMKEIEIFHKISVLVWIIWPIPYFSPLFLGMAG